MAEEQRQQQHLDVRAVDVRVRQDADLAVAQRRQVERVVATVRIDADRDRDVVDLVVGEQPVALGLPGVEHLAAQRQDGLELLVAAHLGRAAGRVALDQENLVAARCRSTRNRSACPAAPPRRSPSSSRPSAPTRGRVCAWRITRSASFLPWSTCWLSHNSSAGRAKSTTSFTASRLFRRSLIWPWNCGSSTFADSTNDTRANTSSGSSLTPFGSRPCRSTKPLTASKRPSRRPDSCVPPAGVGIRLTYDSRSSGPSSVHATTQSAPSPSAKLSPRRLRMLAAFEERDQRLAAAVAASLRRGSRAGRARSARSRPRAARRLRARRSSA